MKHHPPSTFTKEIWSAIDHLLWGSGLILSIPRAASDGLDPEEIETTKQGIIIHGGIWFLLGNSPETNPRFQLHLCLSKPRFSNIESVTPEKLKTATISESTLEDGTLYITLS